MKVIARRSRSDPEKMVFPGAIFCTKTEGPVTVWAIAVGWWDWHVTFLFKRVRPANPTTPTGETHHG